MTSKTKQVGKGDIRRLMKETKTKINSPLAKYNSAGQLTCILCSSVVKNELVWPAHVNGKLHKENVANLKSAKSPAVSAGKTNGVKRKHDNGSSVSAPSRVSSSASSSSSSLPADFFEGASAPKAPRTGASAPKAPRTGASAPKAPRTGASAPSRVSSSASSSSSSSLPADFFEGASAPKAPRTSASAPKAPRTEKLKIIPLSQRKPSGILKNKKPDPPAPPPQPKKVESPSVKSLSPSESPSTPEASSSSAKESSSSSSSSSLPTDFYDSNQSSTTQSLTNGHEKKKKKGKKSKKTEKTDADQPSTESGEPSADDTESGEIPDGFFDDPIEDAKVHHKPYVDPLDAQWELFQKEIKMEAHKSEVIEDEDDEVMIYERALAEVDTQLEGWAKVEALHVKKEIKFIKIEIKDEGESTMGGEQNEFGNANNDEPVIKIEPKDDEPMDEVKEEGEEESDEDDDDFEDLLDWRSKGT